MAENAIRDFYEKCQLEYSEIIRIKGYKLNMLLLPELLAPSARISKRIIMNAPKNAGLENPEYKACRECMLCGMTLASIWRAAPNLLGEDLYKEMCEMKPADFRSKAAAMDYEFMDKAMKELPSELYKKYNELVKPYAKAKDRDDYVFAAAEAFSRMGIMALLSKYGY